MEDIMQKNKKIVSFTDKKALGFIIKECEFSLRELAKHSALIIKNNKNKKFIIIPLTSIFKYSTSNNVINGPIKNITSKINTKQIIENICTSLNIVAKHNGNRFIFRNLDIELYGNNVVFSRIILKLCYEILLICEKQSALEIVSFINSNEFVLEITTISSNFEENKSKFNELNLLLEKIKGKMVIQTLEQNCILFKITMPYENTPS